MVDRDKQYPFMITLLRKREIWPTAFSLLRRWLKNTANQLHFDKQLLRSATLERNIMIDNATNMSARSGCGLINAKALLGGYE